MDVLSLNYTQKTTRIRSGFITSVFWCSIFCFVVSTPSYILFLVFMTLLVFDDLRFFFFFLSLSVVFSSSQKSLKKRASDTEKKPIIAFALALSLVFGKGKSSAKRKEVRERDGISIVGVVGVVIALSLLLRRIDVVACVQRKGDGVARGGQRGGGGGGGGGSTSDGDYEQDESRRVTAENESPPTLHR